MTTRDVERIRFVTQHFNELQGLRTLVPLGLIVLGLGATSFFRSWPLVLLQIVLTVVAAALIFRLGPYYRRTFGEVERRPASLGLEMGSLSIYNPAGPGLGIERRPLSTFLRLSIPAILACALVLILRAIVPSAVLMTDGSGVDPWAQLHPPVVAITETAEIPRSWYDLKPVLGQGMYALFGAFFLGVWLLRKRRLSQGYYLVLGALLLGLAALGTFLGVLLPELWNLKVASLTLFLLPPLAHLWLAMILCGISMVLAGVLDHWQIARVLRPVGEEPA